MHSSFTRSRILTALASLALLSGCGCGDSAATGAAPAGAPAAAPAKLQDTAVDAAQEVWSISGSVQTDGATPLPQGTVVSAQQAGVEVGSAIVDVTTGDYQIGPLLAGTYHLVVIAPGYGFASQTGVEVFATQESAGHDFTLTEAAIGDIDGAVAFTGTLPEAVSVNLTWHGFVVATAAIDTATGAYGFSSVPAGEYSITASDDTCSDTQPATVPEGRLTTVDLMLP